MKVLITGCSNENCWYKDKIGEVFEITEGRYGGIIPKYFVVGMPCSIDKQDCHVIQSVATVLMEWEKSGGELQLWGKNSKSWNKIKDEHRLLYCLNNILRIKPVETPQYRKYTFEEAKEAFTKDGWVESKISRGIGLVTLISKDGICVAQESLTYESLLEKSTHLDGTPCGVKIN